MSTIPKVMTYNQFTEILGRGVITFGLLENSVIDWITQLAFGGDKKMAKTVIQYNSLVKNIKILKSVLEQHMQGINGSDQFLKEANTLFKDIEALRKKRNALIHSRLEIDSHDMVIRQFDRYEQKEVEQLDINDLVEINNSTGEAINLLLDLKTEARKLLK